MDPTFLFFLFLIVVVALATTNDVLKWSDAESLLRKMKKQKQRLEKERAQRGSSAPGDLKSVDVRVTPCAAPPEHILRDKTH